MSTTNTLGPDGDSLYNDKARFTNLEAKTSPLPHHKEVELRNLLHLVRIILSHTTLPLPQSKDLPKMKKTTERTESWDSETMHIIGQQIAGQDGISDSEKTWRILETDPEIPLKTKAILSLVAFATMYGRLRLAALVETNQLAKSITLLKRQPNVGSEEKLKKWFEDISSVINLTLDVTDGVMDLKETQPLSNKENSSRKSMLLSTAVYRIINIVVICWSQVVNILIKRNWKDIHTNKWTLSTWDMALNDKRREIEEEIGKEKKQRQAPEVKREEAQNDKMAERGSSSSLSCWWKLREMLHPTPVKSRRPSMLLYTANHSLPHTHTISSTSQGALPMDKEAAKSSSGG